MLYTTVAVEILGHFHETIHAVALVAIAVKIYNDSISKLFHVVGAPDTYDLCLWVTKFFQYYREGHSRVSVRAPLLYIFMFFRLWDARVKDSRQLMKQLKRTVVVMIGISNMISRG